MSGKLAPVDELLSKEWVYRDGVGYVSIRALARLLGVADTSIVRGAAIGSVKLGKSLAAAGFSPAAIKEWSATGIPDAACAVITHHFAYEARQTSDRALAYAKTATAIWFRQRCQGFDEAHQKLIPIAKQARKDFTQVLGDHGCEREHFITITDNNNRQITGRYAYELKRERAPGVDPKSISGRALMTLQEREQTMALEVMEKAQVLMQRPSNGNECISVCSATSAAFMRLLTEPLAGALPFRQSVSPYEPFRPEMAS